MASMSREFSPAKYCRGVGVRYHLLGEKCKNRACTDPLIFPPRDICPDCLHDTSQPDRTPRAVEMNFINRVGHVTIFQFQEKQKRGRGI